MARTPSKLKEPVRIRFKQLSNGSKSIYLDTYKDGKREYEFLKLYLLPEYNAHLKAQNKVTLAAAEKIKSQRVIELTENAAGMKHTSQRSRLTLADWMQTYLEQQEKKGLRSLKLIRTVKDILAQYDKNARMRDIQKEFCLGFIDFLRNRYKTRLGKPLTPKSMADYFGVLTGALNAAVRADVISENPVLKLTQTERIKVPESKREFLTIEELRLLIHTDCLREDVKRAFLFSCYCGLRLSDIYNMVWRDISLDGEQWRVSVVMKKTATPIYLPLSGQAMNWLPERDKATDADNVFSTLPAEPNINKTLKNWMDAAGITKHITYHCSRHTFATMMLTLGADLYTVCKLLGHSNVKTTQIYAKIIDRKKDEAIGLLDDAFRN